MATNNTWGQYTWGAGSWGEQATDVNVYVGGTYDPTWGYLTWGYGPYGAATPDPNLNLTVSVGTVTVLN